MRLAVVFRRSDSGKWNHAGRVEHSKSETGSEESLHRAIDVGFAENSFLHGLESRLALGLYAGSWIAADQVRARFQPGAHTFFHGFGEVMPGKDIGDRSAIGDDVAVEPPVVAQMLLQQDRIGAGRLPVNGVVSAHDGIG